MRTAALGPSSTLRLVLGRDLYAAVPAGQARTLAHLLRLALREIGRRDGIAAVKSRGVVFRRLTRDLVLG